MREELEELEEKSRGSRVAGDDQGMPMFDIPPDASYRVERDEDEVVVVFGESVTRLALRKKEARYFADRIKLEARELPS